MSHGVRQYIERVTGEYFEGSEPLVILQHQRMRVQHVPQGESMTLQSEASACDINEIVRKYDQTGFLPVARMEPQYGDVSELNGDFGELLNKSIDALTIYNNAKADFEHKKSADAKALADAKEAEYQALKAAAEKVKANEVRTPPT
ncbi:MAG: internal scaffolding protein [Microviridae sp.]|nr:MAG: internal scaffolding protein [Microviridae sp.]